MRSDVFPPLIVLPITISLTDHL